MADAGYEVMYTPASDHKCRVPDIRRVVVTRNTIVSCAECGTLWRLKDSWMYDGPVWRQIRWYHFGWKKKLNG